MMMRDNDEDDGKESNREMRQRKRMRRERKHGAEGSRKHVASWQC